MIHPSDTRTRRGMPTIRAKPFGNLTMLTAIVMVVRCVAICCQVRC